MTDNLFLGGNQLVIAFWNGTFCVLESFEDCQPVFTGSYEKCLDYMRTRYIEYLESLL